MATKTGNLQRAERKVQHQEGREWGGYLTPSEALALVEDGARLTHDHKAKLRSLEIEVEQGDSAPAWIYFYASHTQQKRWGSGSGRPARRR
jgi:hypothetical protein